MPKKIDSQIEPPRKSFLEKISFLLIALFLVAVVYGGLSIFKLQKQNQAMLAKQNILENRIADLQNQIIDGQNKIAQVSDTLDKTTNDLTKTKKDLAYYRQLALEPKEVLPEIIPATTNQPINVIPASVTKTKTVYVKAKPKYEAVVTIKNVGSYKVAVTAGDNAFTILKKAAAQYGFKLEYDTYSFGVFVTSIAGNKPAANQFWAFYYNGKFSDVGAQDQPVSTNDTTFWQMESF